MNRVEQVLGVDLQRQRPVASNSQIALKQRVQLAQRSVKDQSTLQALNELENLAERTIEDLRRMAQYGPVLGRFNSLASYFQSTMYAGQSVRYQADKYRSPYLKQEASSGVADPISRWAQHHRRVAAANAVQSLRTMTDLIGGLLGLAVGLAIAKTVIAALAWADTANPVVQFMHSLALVVLPYLGLVIGARNADIFVQFLAEAVLPAARSFGSRLKASMTLAAPQAQGNRLLAPQAKLGPHLPA